MIKKPVQRVNANASIDSILNDLPCEVIKLPTSPVTFQGGFTDTDITSAGIYIIREDDFNILTKTIPLFDIHRELELDSEPDSDFVILQNQGKDNQSSFYTHGVYILPFPGYPKTIHHVVSSNYAKWVVECHKTSAKCIPSGTPGVVPPFQYKQPDAVYVVPVKESTYIALSSLMDVVTVTSMSGNPDFSRPTMNSRYSGFFSPNLDNNNFQSIDVSVLLNAIIGYEMLSDYLHK